MNVPTRTQILDYCIVRELVVIIGVSKDGYGNENMTVTFTHSPLLSGSSKFKIRRRMAHALGSGCGVLYGPERITFYARDPRS